MPGAAGRSCIPSCPPLRVELRPASQPNQARPATAAARLADEVGFPLLIDLRPGLVILDSGKDLWDADAHGLDVDFSALAARVQRVARGLGATAYPGMPRFVQLFLDAAHVASVRAFWAAALGYTFDRRTDTTDIVDPHRINPVVVFQRLDPSEVERRRQRNRIRVELAVPSDQAMARRDAMVAAGGRLVDEATDRWRLADPEGNELDLVSGA